MSNKKRFSNKIVRNTKTRIKRSFQKFERRVLRTDIERILTLGYVSKVPQRQLTVGYLSYIIAGTALLLLPFMTNKPTSFLDHLFTATSAVSTTGLATVDVSQVYNFWGQLVILLLVQLGGLGYMTISSFAMLRMTKHFTQIKSGIINAEFSRPANISMKNLVEGIIVFTLIFEVLGAIALYPMMKMAGASSPLWSAVFHSVSAFCTAGFSIYSDNLMQFSTHWGISLVITILCYAGAMGFIVMIDLWKKITVKGYQISFTTQIIIGITLLISTWGTVQLYYFEPTLKQFDSIDRFLVALFQTMSALTTAGYNSIDITSLYPLSLLTMVVVMYLGASPSGTGGGLKSTTTSAVYAYVKSKLSEERDVYLFGRRIPTYRVDTALSTFIFYTTILFIGSYMLCTTEKQDYLHLLFEAASALGTVGLSSGVSAELTSIGKIIIISLMFVGRVGVLTIGNAMLIRMTRASKKKLIKEDDLVV